MPRYEAARPLDTILSKREQQVMEVVHRRGEVTAADVHRALPDAASYNAVRGVLRGLEEKGRLDHHRDGRSFVYRATVAPDSAGRSALRRVADTFFAGSTERLVAGLLEAERPSDEELDRLQALIDEARRRGGGG